MKKMKPAAEELAVITKAYEMVREMTARVKKFPRDSKFVLGDRIVNNACDILDKLIEAKYTKDKVHLLDRANIQLEQMRFQVRLAHDEKYVSTQQYAVAARIIDEVGRLVGGWRKSRAQ